MLFLRGSGCCPANAQSDVNRRKRKKRNYHQDQRKRKHFIVPRKNPGRVGNAGYEEQQADLLRERHGLRRHPNRLDESIYGVNRQQQVNDRPNQESQARGHEQVRLLIGEFSRRFPSQRDGVSQRIEANDIQYRQQKVRLRFGHILRRLRARCPHAPRSSLAPAARRARRAPCPKACRPLICAYASSPVASKGFSFLPALV